MCAGKVNQNCIPSLHTVHENVIKPLAFLSSTKMDAGMKELLSISNARAQSPLNIQSRAQNSLVLRRNSQNL